MGILDALTNLSPEQSSGLLAAAGQLLNTSPYQPANFGAAIGAFQQGTEGARRRKQEEEQAQQMSAMRALQMRGMAGDLGAQERAQAQQAAIQQAAQESMGEGGQFDPQGFIGRVRGIDPLKALELERQMAKAGPKFDSGITFVNGPDGRPVAVRTADDGSIKQLDGLAPREKAELVNLGGKSVAVNPFDVQPGQQFQRTASPDAMLSASTAMRGQNMTDSRTRDANALKYEEIGIKRGEKAREADLGKAGQIASFDTMLGTLDRLGNHAGLARSTGLMSKVPTMPGSDSANFQAELETFKSQAFVPMVAQLKGMGALSDAEGRKLTAAVGALDPNMSERAFKESIGRVVREMNSARNRVVDSASPALRQSLGAPDAAPPAPKAAAPRAPMKGQVVDGYRFKGGNPADPNSWERK